jgi:hypothetical protein
MLDATEVTKVLRSTIAVCRRANLSDNSFVVTDCSQEIWYDIQESLGYGGKVRERWCSPRSVLPGSRGHRELVTKYREASKAKKAMRTNVHVLDTRIETSRAAVNTSSHG